MYKKLKYEQYFIDFSKLHLFGPPENEEEMDDIYYILKLMHRDVIDVSETIRFIYDYYPDEFEDKTISSNLKLDERMLLKFVSPI